MHCLAALMASALDARGIGRDGSRDRRRHLCKSSWKSPRCPANSCGLGTIQNRLLEWNLIDRAVHFRSDSLLVEVPFGGAWSRQ
jgi:hypothetical protein